MHPEKCELTLFPSLNPALSLCFIPLLLSYFDCCCSLSLPLFLLIYIFRLTLQILLAPYSLSLLLFQYLKSVFLFTFFTLFRLFLLITKLALRSSFLNQQIMLNIKLKIFSQFVIIFLVFSSFPPCLPLLLCGRNSYRSRSIRNQNSKSH